MIDYGATDGCQACIDLESKAGNHTPECRARFHRMLERDGKIKPITIVEELPLTPADPLRGTPYSSEHLMDLFDEAEASRARARAAEAEATRMLAAAHVRARGAAVKAPVRAQTHTPCMHICHARVVDGRKVFI